MGGDLSVLWPSIKREEDLSDVQSLEGDISSEYEPAQAQDGIELPPPKLVSLNRTPDPARTIMFEFKGEGSPRKSDCSRWLGDVTVEMIGSLPGGFW